MKNLLKKLHIMSNQQEDTERGSTSSRANKSIDGSSPDRHLIPRSHHGSENKPFSGLSGWLNSVANRHSSNLSSSERTEPADAVTITGLDVASDALGHDSGSTNSRDPDVEEEYQIQLALELSAREDPEAVQIEAVKQISLGSCAPDNTPAEVVAYRYWVSFSSSCSRMIKCMFDLSLLLLCYLLVYNFIGIKISFIFDLI